MMETDNEPKVEFFTIKQSRKLYDFSPQADITPLELAWISHFFAMFSTGNLLIPNSHPQWVLIERHFKEL